MPAQPISPSLAARLAAAGLWPPAGVPAEPLETWRRLRAAEGPRATIIDLYELVAAPRGLAAHELPRAERTALSDAALPEVWPGFARTVNSERTDIEVEVIPCDPAWPARFGSWRARLARELGGAARRIDHVGSTSVPGLPAKPTVDIQVSVDDLEDESRYVEQIERTGLLLRSRDDLHRFFRPPAGLPRDVHVHVCPAGSDWEREHLLFRDYLRSHAAAREAYAAAKAEAARIWPDDRIAYTEAKASVILDLMAAAQAWLRG